MVRNKILRASALVAASAGVMLNTVAVAGASPSSGEISTTGFNSSNRVISKDSFRLRDSLKVANHNNVLVGNATYQDSFSGDAHQSKNTTGGSVATGDATNHSVTSTALDVSNSTPSLPMPIMADIGGGNGGSGHIDTTGADSSNVVVNKRDVSVSQKEVIANVNNIAVLNATKQSASSGDASSSKNTTAGDVMTGSASNESTTTTTVTISN